jgi:hypothetical protein
MMPLGTKTRDTVLAGHYSKKTMELIRKGRAKIEKMERKKRERNELNPTENLPPKLLARYSEKILKFMEEKGRIPMAKEIGAMAAVLSKSRRGVTVADIIRQVEPVKAQIEAAEGVIRMSTALNTDERELLSRRLQGATQDALVMEFRISNVTLGKMLYAGLGRIVGELEAAGVKDWAWLFGVEKPEIVRDAAR